MKEKRIEFETAKLANSKGFNIETYELDYMVDGNNAGMQGACVSCTTYIKCSTQKLLQKWLRENYDVQVYCVPNDNVAEVWHYKIDKTYKRLDTLSQHYQSYEEALEAGLREGLKLINDER